jgi:hypothetical protein
MGTNMVSGNGTPRRTIATRIAEIHVLAFTTVCQAVTTTSYK